MTDTHLRQLERAANQGDVEARARLLCERVRMGDLSEDRVRLAAYLGDPGARLHLGEQAPELPAIRARAGLELNQRRWVTGLRAYGKEWLVRAAAAVAVSRLEAWSRWDETDDRPRRALAAARAWIRCPCDAHARAADGAHDAALGAAQALVAPGDPPPAREGLSRQLCAVAGAAATAAFAAAQAARAAASDDVLQASACVLNVLGGREDTETIREALVAAALGRADDRGA